MGTKVSNPSDLILELAKAIHDSAKGHAALTSINAGQLTLFATHVDNAIVDSRSALDSAATALKGALAYEEDLIREQRRQVVVGDFSGIAVRLGFAEHHDTGEMYLLSYSDGPKGPVIRQFAGPLDEGIYSLVDGTVAGEPMEDATLDSDQDQVVWLQGELEAGGLVQLEVGSDGEDADDEDEPAEAEPDPPPKKAASGGKA